MTETRVLIVVFDALRPEFVTPSRMPNLCAFARMGVRYPNMHSTFPTETRVNQSAVTTGCMPSRHGVVGNAFLADDLLPGRLVNTGDDTALSEIMAAGPVLTVPNMGQRLAAAGRRYASLSAGTPGGGRLINWSAEQDATFRLSMRAPAATVPVGALAEIETRVGPMPDSTPPALDWIGWAVSAYIEYVDPVVAPDVMLLWLCEPDESFHWHGIGSDESLAAIQRADAEFGRILTHLESQIDDGAMHVIAMSDHGQLTLEGRRLDLIDKIAATGLRASRSDLNDCDCLVSLANGGGIWLRDRDPRVAERLVTWLREQPWCGPVFSRTGVAGTLRQAELCLDHPRAPDISLVLRARDDPNREGIGGISVHDAPYPEGGGCHGGLSKWELNNVLVLGGRRIRQGSEIGAPAGNIDILPTVFELVGLPTPDGIHGRVLREAFRDGPDPESLDWSERVIASTNSGPVTRLDISEIEGVRYLNRAWVE